RFSFTTQAGVEAVNYQQGVERRDLVICIRIQKLRISDEGGGWNGGWEGGGQIVNDVQGIEGRHLAIVIDVERADRVVPPMRLRHRNCERLRQARVDAAGGCAAVIL